MAAQGACAALAERGGSRGVAPALSWAECGGCFATCQPPAARSGAGALPLASRRGFERHSTPLRAAPALRGRRRVAAACAAVSGAFVDDPSDTSPQRKLEPAAKPRTRRRVAEPQPASGESGGSATPVVDSPASRAQRKAPAESAPTTRVRRMRLPSVKAAAVDAGYAGEAAGARKSVMLPAEVDEEGGSLLLGLDFMFAVSDARTELELRQQFPADFNRAFAGYSQLSRRQRLRARRPLLEAAWSRVFNGAQFPSMYSEREKELGVQRSKQEQQFLMQRYQMSKRALFKAEDRHIDVELEYLEAWDKELARRQDEEYRAAREAAGLSAPLQYETPTGVQRIGSMANAMKLAAGGVSLPAALPERSLTFRKAKDAVGLDCAKGVPMRREPGAFGVYTASENPDINEESLWLKEDHASAEDADLAAHFSRWTAGSERLMQVASDEADETADVEDTVEVAPQAPAPLVAAPPVTSVGQRLRDKFQERRWRSLDRMRAHLPTQVALQDERATPAEKRAAEAARAATLGGAQSPAEQRAAARYREGGATKVMNEPLDVMQLLPGEVVVHRLNGVARFLGFREDAAEGSVSLVLEFADSRAKLTHTAASRLLYRYNSRRRPLMADSEAGRKVRLSKLKDPSTWLKQQAKQQANVNRLVMHVMDVYVQRIMVERPPYPEVSPAKYAEFAAGFKYPLTVDQTSAVEDIYDDMSRETPMDRLVVGDVGFGKTEVAMRAVLRAVLAGKQVLVLAPTTVLARQHAELFGTRFRAMGIDCGFLTRFTSATERTRLRARMAEGTQLLIVGTHALITDAQLCPNLGLLVVDEEQRFGVKQKERITHLLSTLDVLTLSATPIPRTLHMAMSGFRDASIIASPPPGRMAIQTHVLQYGSNDNAIIAEAINYELERGGQVFYVTPRIEQQAKEKERLEALIPGVRIELANGQMDMDQLDETMDRFSEGAFDVLLCTTIVESGLDMPRVNTIIIIDAQQFGLASLYQLRGRVGRNDKQAFAYLFYSTEGVVSEKQDDDSVREEERLMAALADGNQAEMKAAAKRHAVRGAAPGAKEASVQRVERRMNAIRQANELGGGFQLSGDDMDIRGVGSVFGSKQSGGETVLGMDMYMEMLYATLANVELMHVPVIPFDDVLLGPGYALPPTLPRGMFSAEDAAELLASVMEAARAGPEAMRSLLVRLQDVMEGPVAMQLESVMANLATRWYASQLGVTGVKYSREFGIEVWQTGMSREAFDLISVRPARLRSPYAAADLLATQSLMPPLLRDAAREMFDFPAPELPRTKASRKGMSAEEREQAEMEDEVLARKLKVQQSASLLLSREAAAYRDNVADKLAGSYTPLAVLRAMHEVTPGFMRFM